MTGSYQVVSYEKLSGKKPFDEWICGLLRRNQKVAAVIDARLARIRDNGNFGDSRALGQGVCELRIHLGPGYRVYYLLNAVKMVVLLTGGEKRSQTRDIARAQEYASDFWERL